MVDAAFLANLLATDYEQIMGNGLSLNGWIASSLSKITSFSEAELLAELEKSDRLGMLNLCSPEALAILNNALIGHMNSQRTADRLREIQSCRSKFLEFYGAEAKFISADDLASETFEYIEPEPIVPAIEFVDVDPETKAQILQMMGQDNAA